jgi:uncharacterized membrane protein
VNGTAGVRDHVLDLVFLVGLLVKGLDGLAELVVGVPLLLLTRGQLTGIAQAVTAQELSEDPHDLVANLVLHGVATASPGGLLLGGLYLIVHGVVKLAIVLALVFGKRRIYPWAIAALGAFTVFQLVELVLQPTVTVALLTVLDVVIVVLTWREWRHGRTLRETLRTTVDWLRPRRRVAGR